MPSRAVSADWLLEAALVEGVLLEGALVEGALVEGALVEGALVEGALVEGVLLEWVLLAACSWRAGFLLACCESEIRQLRKFYSRTNKRASGPQYRGMQNALYRWYSEMQVP